MYSSPLARCFNDLIGALLLDNEFQQKFMLNRAEAINWYNTVFAPQYQQRRLEFSANQLKLIVSIRAGTLDEFIELAAQFTSSLQNEAPTTKRLNRNPRLQPGAGD